MRRAAAVPPESGTMAIQANFGFINVWDGGGIKRLFFSVQSVGVIRSCWNIWLIKSVCLCTHVFRQCDILPLGV